MRRPLSRRCCLFAALLSLSVCAVRAEQPAAAPHDFAKWESAIADFEAQDQAQPPRDDDVMFIGSSTMRLWKTSDCFPDLAVVNRGFGGSEMIDSVHYASRIFGAHRPRVLLVYAGGNDLAKGVMPSTVAEHFEQLVVAVQAISPDTQIVYLSMKPTVKRWPIVHRVRAVNALIESTCVDLPNVHFLNVHPAMLNAEGRPETAYLAKDGLHLNDLGYQHLTALVRPTIDRLLAGETDAAPTPAATPAAGAR